MIRRTGAEIIIRLLERQGIRVIAGIPGGANLPLYDALLKSSLIRHVLARHEQGAGFMAQGMARVTGKPAVCLATSGPGAVNLITAIADAKADSIPVIAITGQVTRGLLGSDAFQEVDICAIAGPVTKACFQAGSAAELLEIVPRAFALAASGRPGPVLIDVPKDVQLETAAFDAWPDPGFPNTAPPIDRRALEKIAALLNMAARPLLCLGGGAVRAGAGQIALRLAEKAAIPMVQTLMGLGAAPFDHPLSLGMMGMHAARSTNLALDECDFLLAVGSRFDDRATGRLDGFCPGAHIAHIDIDPAQIGRIVPVEAGLAADAGEALAALLPLVRPDRRQRWTERIGWMKRRYPPQPLREYGLHMPQDLIRQAAEIAGEETIVVTDVGQHQMWTAQSYPFRRSGRWLTSGGLGTMGFGLPVAIGASLARPQTPVLCFSGDGSLMMNLQELVTAAEEQVNVKIIVMNNGALGLVRQQQEMFYGRRLCASEFSRRVDFAAIAQASGISACDLGQTDDPESALREALQAPGPGLINAPIRAAGVFPMVAPGAANSQMIEEEDLTLLEPEASCLEV